MSEKARVLIVDDESSVSTAIRLALDGSRYEVDVASSAEEALPRIREKGCDLLLLDKNLPGKSGIELLQILRAEGNDVWCVMMTAYASPESAVETLNLGVHAYLEKPFDDIYKVAQRIDQLVASWRAHTALRTRIDEMRKLAKAFEEARFVKVLIASPNRAELEWMANCFRRDTDKIRLAETGEELLRELERQPANVLIIDAAIGGADATELIARATALCKDLLPVVVTEKPPLRVATRYIEVGVRAVIEKPLTEQTFWPRLSAVLSRVRNEVAIEALASMAGVPEGEGTP